MTPKQIAADLNRRHPGLGIKLGYIGNLYPSGVDNRCWMIFTDVCPDGRSISYGGWDSHEVQKPLTSSELMQIAHWMDTEVIPNKKSVWKKFSVRIFNADAHAPLVEKALLKAGASFGMKGHGRWMISVQGMDKEDVERLVTKYSAGEVLAQ